MSNNCAVGSDLLRIVRMYRTLGSVAQVRKYASEGKNKRAQTYLCSLWYKRRTGQNG